MGRIIVAGGCRTAAPVAGVQLGTIAEGQTVKLRENGTPVEFYVAKHNYEPALNGNGRTLLVRKECHSKRAWNNANVNTYATATIDQWLNNGYKNLLDAHTQNAIGRTKFYYNAGNGTDNIRTLDRSVFILSVKELAGVAYDVNDGTELPISNVLKIAMLNGTPVNQWTRSPVKGVADSVLFMQAENAGLTGGIYCMYSANGVRPCFTLPATALFDEKTMELKGVA